MTKELELSKKLAVLGWIFRKGLITEDEYNRTRIHIMGEYGVISFMIKVRERVRTHVSRSYTTNSPNIFRSGSIL